MFNNFIFDLDGTLINSFAEVKKCFILAFEKANYPVDKSRLTPEIIGPPLEDIVRNIIPEEKDQNKINEIVENYNFFYDNEENDISEVYDGIYNLLETLKSNNKKIFMATYKPNAPTLRIARQFNLIDYFEEIYTIDKFREFITKTQMIEMIIEKYHLKKDETVMIGDAVSDMTCAKEAGVFASGVLWGYGSDKQPLIENSDTVFEKVSDIYNLIQ